jgi:site-specific DNA recombinase
MTGSGIIPSIDRLSRDVRIAENLFWQLDQLGVRVLIADMPNYDRNNRKDVLIRQIREAIAEENRKEIIERLWKGRRERVREGKPSGGVVPYGYRRRRKRFQPHPIESIVVRRIFKMSASGASCTSIARDLNGNGYARRNGKPWTRWQVLAGILRYGSVTATDQSLIII